MLNFRRDVIEGLQDPTFEDKRRVLELLQTRITVQGGRVDETAKRGNDLSVREAAANKKLASVQICSDILEILDEIEHFVG